MHKSAYNNALNFYEKYCKNNIENKTILEVGSWGVDIRIRSIFNLCQKYIGLDSQHGNNVDVVANANEMPFSSNEFNIIISTSCFEHDEMFWLTFLEMSRVLKPSGYIYICAPSSGPYHPQHCPSDSWRFYLDSWKSLEKWSLKNNLSIRLLESYIDNSFFPPDENWQDSIGIFTKD
jgi:ubiquinone/menaquinone biosynthesis C-methylase UbiE